MDCQSASVKERNRNRMLVYSRKAEVKAATAMTRMEAMETAMTEQRIAEFESLLRRAAYILANNAAEGDSAADTLAHEISAALNS